MLVKQESHHIKEIIKHSDSDVEMKFSNLKTICLKDCIHYLIMDFINKNYVL